MKNEFSYKKKFSFSYFFPFIAFVILAFLCEYYHYGIRFKKLNLLQYPNSFFLMVICTILFLIYAIYKYISSSKSAKNPHPIEITEYELSFPKGANEKITVEFDSVKELWNKTDKDYGKQVIIYTLDGHRHEFSEDHFINSNEFNQFNTLMAKYCTKITNR